MMAENAPMEIVRQICSMVGLPKNLPTTAVTSTMIEPEVSTVWMLPR